MVYVAYSPVTKRNTKR